MSDVTRILNAIQEGDSQAAHELLPLVYEELRILAAQKLAQEKPGQTLQATALVHEAYLRLVGAPDQNWHSRGHFFRAASEAIRRILIENARRKQRIRHGGGYNRIPFEESQIAIQGLPDDLIALDEALHQLENENHTKAELVKLRYFTGLTLDQAAEVLGISTTTAKRYWLYARAWLFRAVQKDR